MLRYWIGLALSVLFVATVAGCGGGNDDASGDRSAGTQTSASESKVQPRPAVPPKPDMPKWTEGVYAKPYFDEAGSVTEKAVSPGDNFDVYLFAEYPEPYKIAAAEFRLVLPKGVRVAEQHLFREKVLSMGDHATDFVMTFECDSPSPGRFYLVKYLCAVDPEFDGGEIEVAPGVNSKDESYLGFVACEEPVLRRLPARGGAVTLTKK